MIAGPIGPVCAGLTGVPAPSYKEGAAVQLGGGAKKTLLSAQNPPAGSLKIPKYFEVNRGQTDASVKFFTRAAGYNLYLTASEAVTVLPRAVADKTRIPVVVRMKLKGANANPTVRGLDILPGHTNYFLGNDRSKWQTGVKQYAKVKFGQVYPGIDMVYRFNKGQVEYDFIVAPGANPGRILIGFEGNKGLRLDPQGNLVLSVEGGEMTYKAPELYQTLGAKRVSVKGRFVLASNKNVRFEVENYVKSRELVIDPTLAYSSFLGGTVDDEAYAVIVDASNNAYITGSVLSDPFPGAAATYDTSKDIAVGSDIFVTKITAAGAMGWSTYYGGAGIDIGKAIGIDGTGNVYVTGSTTDGVTFPQSAFFGTRAGTDAFLISLNNTGTARNYGIVFGGAGGEESGNGLAVNAAGQAYVTGNTNSASFPFTAGAAQVAFGAGGNSDAFVAKFSAAGAQLYATYLGGTGIDIGNAIAIDLTGNAYITGQTSANLPVAPVAPPALAAFKLTVTGSNDALIAKLDSTGANWLYVTYVGGGDQDEGTGIALGAEDIVYITGWTLSGDFPGASFVTVGQTTKGTAEDAFVFKLHIGNGGLTNDGVYATYLGASAEDRGTAIAVDGDGNAYVTGRTWSGDFPMVGPLSGAGTLVGAPEAFVTKLGPTGATIGFSSYLGGTTMTRGQGIALDTSKNIYLTGYTNSDAATFPLATPFQSANAGSFDAFITKIGAPAVPVACTINSISPVSGFRVGGTTVTINITDFTGFLSTTTGVTFDGTNAQRYSANSSSTVITAVSPRHPLTGDLLAGLVSLTVTTHAGACSVIYKYIAAPVTDTGACGEDFLFPSPATGATAEFAYCMDQPGTAKIRVYNVIGDLASKLENTVSKGGHIAALNTARLASGVYLYIIEKNYDDGTSNKSGVKKFVVKH
ncbi:MAG: hypothetical protein A2X34_05430 [Elusimicrobia bacterium GWC2_51_8]|nr:MAG: hypothetical protein A2X33_00830 [Elusimicrobia bacterium GWA2_51_34]OGR59181.1 MAG: hypothetical protein A2X34_05430 [Elusimicrobia bacterium GWC2_51_8]OGR84506.1 MAG: hypothetical protein A2021_03110 [Elusimicrobia bacterium GWF2_52_66]